MAALDLTSFDAALKVHYTDDRVKMMSYEDAALLAILPKYTKFGGKNLPIPVQFGNPQGRSSTFANAQANKTASKYEDFVITRARDYGLASIDNETLLAAQGDKNAFLEAATSEIDGVINSVKQSLSRSLFGDGSGTIGIIGSGTASPLTLADPNDIVNFELGMTIAVVNSTSDPTAALHTGTGVISAINRSTGVITYTGTITTPAPGNYIVQDGDAYATSPSGYKKLTGLAGWLPAAAPTSTLFFGVNRAVDTDRLGGIRYDGSSETIEEALIGAAHRLARESARPTHAIMNPVKVGQLVKALGSKVEFDSVRAADAEIGFEAIKIRTPVGVLKVVSDRQCPTEVGYMLQMDTWKLYSLGNAPRILDTDGMKFLREASADAVEVRVGYYAQLGCSAPGWNARIKFA